MNQFRIPIGDWSNDGHGHCDYYTVQCNKSSAEFDKAFRLAAKKFSKLNPSNFCDRYQDSRVPEHIVEALANAQQYRILLGFDETYKVPEDFEEKSIGMYWDMSAAMAEYVVWFAQLADPELVVTFIKEVPMWNPCGHIGYGLYNG